jgi:hypothetical protein
VIRVYRASAISAEKCSSVAESSHIGLYFQHEYSSSLFPEFFLALNRHLMLSFRYQCEMNACCHAKVPLSIQV